MKFTKLFISFALIASVALSASSCAQSGKVQSETDSAEPKQTESVTLEQQNSGEKQENDSGTDVIFGCRNDAEIRYSHCRPCHPRR